jgi:ABC transport system ATP-binding/permease protein
MGRDGRMSYCGPPGGMLSAFRSETHAEAMQALRAGARAVGSGPVVIGNDPVAVPVHPEVRARLAEPGPGLAQVTSVLLRREIRRMWSGPLTLARGTLLLPVLAIVLTALASDRGLSGSPGDPNRMQVAALSVLITCTTFFAMALSFSSIVGERAVIEREFRWEVPASGVVLSKGLALIPLVLAQSVITMTGYLVWRPGPDTPLGTVPSWLVLGTGLSALGLCSMSLGLLISAAAPRLDRAVFGLMGVVALLVVLNGLLIPLGNPSSIGGDVLAALSQLAPTRWGTAAIAAEMGFVPNEVMARGGTVSDDPLWGHDFHHVVVALMALVALGGSYLLGAAELLVTQSRRRR